MLISLQITPKSTKNEIIGWIKDGFGKPVLKIKVAAVPEGGKANAELIKFLAKEWGVARACLEIVSGDTSRHKRLKIHNIDIYEDIIATIPLS